MTTKLIIFREQNSEQLVAYVIRQDTFEVNGVPVLGADIVFIAATKSSKPFAADTALLQKMAVSEMKRSRELNIRWFESHEIWNIPPRQ